MARTPDLQRRRQLLDALVEEFADGGVGDRSLREVAAAVGTSHRMLLHHFGSREELLVAIVEHVERRQMTLLPDLPTDPADNFAAMWAEVRRPELRRLRTALLRVLRPARPGREAVRPHGPGAVDGWLSRSRPLPASARSGDGPARAGRHRADCCWIWSPPTTMPACDAAAEVFVESAAPTERRIASVRRLLGFRQHRDDRVDEFFGGGVPLVQIHVAAQIQSGDAVRGGQQESTVTLRVPRTGDATHDVEEQVLGAFG